MGLERCSQPQEHHRRHGAVPGKFGQPARGPESAAKALHRAADTASVWAGRAGPGRDGMKVFEPAGTGRD